MNAILAQLFAFFNAVVGFIIVFFGCLVGYAILSGNTINGYSFSEAAPLAVATIIFAIFVAVMLCGLIALLAEIERHLREMKESNIRRSKPSLQSENKTDPQL